MGDPRTASHAAVTRPEEALPDDAFELVGAGWREHRPALRRPGWRQRLARLPLLPLGLLLLLVLGCLCAPWLANHDPAEFYLADRNTPPGSRFFFGTDSLGRDIYSIIWFGGRASLLIGLLSAAVITVLGVSYGCLSGIAPARTDALLMRLVELVQSIPVLLVLLLAVSLLGPQNALSIALLIGVTGWFALARIVRGEVRQIRHSEYILASRCMGGSFGWIMRRHLVPNVVSAILFVVISAVSTSIAMESTLSFLGLGLPVDELSWGSMLALADKALLLNTWWVILIPGLFLALALLTAHPALAADMANTLVYAGENEDTINPVLSPHQELPTIIFSGLMKFDAKGLPVPDLAKSVDYDPKTLTYTFHLRDGVKWHDGTPFSARDVVYTYTALTSDKTLTSTITSNYQDISQISAPDEHTVVIRLARVNAAMLDNFCMGILPAHLYEGHDINTVPANHAPVGTGRFKFVSWDTAGGMIVLERNTDYYGKVPSIERIVYKTVAVESTKALMLRSGEADLAWLNAKYARTFRGKDGFTTVDFTTADLRTVAMDFHTPFWQRNKDSIAVLNYAVDKQAIVDGVLAGQGFPAFSPIQTSPLGGNPAADVYPYDLKKFAAEMERLGWKKGADGIYARNGERFSFTIQVRDYEEERVDIINVLSRQFKKAGVEMNIALVTRFDWKAGYNGYLAGFAAEFDPDGVFKSFVTGASDNNMAYSSPRVDELLRAGRATEDPAKRKAAYQAFEVAYAAMPAQLPLVYLHGNYVSVAGLKGLDTTRVLGHHAVGVMWNIEDWTLQR